MGTGHQMANLPSRPKIVRDARNVPWTNGIENQEKYANGLEL